MKKTIGAAALALLQGLTGSAVAEDFPSRSMVMIIPFAAGGPTDVLGRIIAQRMGEVLGQTIVVENVGGAGGMAGSKRRGRRQARRLYIRNRHASARTPRTNRCTSTRSTIP